jgi:hypothetical protein
MGGIGLHLKKGGGGLAGLKGGMCTVNRSWSRFSLLLLFFFLNYHCPSIWGVLVPSVVVGVRGSGRARARGGGRVDECVGRRKAAAKRVREALQRREKETERKGKEGRTDEARFGSDLGVLFSQRGVWVNKHTSIDRQTRSRQQGERARRNAWERQNKQRGRGRGGNKEGKEQERTTNDRRGTADGSPLLSCLCFCYLSLFFPVNRIERSKHPCFLLF